MQILSHMKPLISLFGIIIIIPSFFLFLVLLKAVFAIVTHYLITHLHLSILFIARFGETTVTKYYSLPVTHVVSSDSLTLFLVGEWVINIICILSERSRLGLIRFDGLTCVWFVHFWCLSMWCCTFEVLELCFHMVI